MKYYTYAYLRKNGTPYYIGKGSGDRIYVKRRRINLPKDKTRIIFLKQNLTEEEAFKHEKYMIAIFGRKDLGTGILHNVTDGGEGTSGRIVTEEEKSKMRERELGNKRCVGRKLSEETKDKIRKSKKGKKLTEEQKKNFKQRRTKPLLENPSKHTLYMREWKKRKIEKNKISQQKYESEKLQNEI